MDDNIHPREFKNLGTALGFEPGLEFERTELQLRPGDTLILYSDGVSEAFNGQEECYGNERLLADAVEVEDDLRAGRYFPQPAAQASGGEKSGTGNAGGACGPGP